MTEFGSSGLPGVDVSDPFDAAAWLCRAVGCPPLEDYAPAGRGWSWRGERGLTDARMARHLDCHFAARLYGRAVPWPVDVVRNARLCAKRI